MFVIVNSSGINNNNSQELVVNKMHDNKDRNLRKYFAVSVIQPDDMPSTSKDRNEMSHPQLKVSISQDEVQMIDINLQSEIEIPCDDDNDSDSIVISYLKNKDIFLHMDGTILSTKKKPSLLKNVPKMETILEGQQFTTYTPSISQMSMHMVLEKDTEEQ